MVGLPKNFRTYRCGAIPAGQQRALGLSLTSRQYWQYWLVPRARCGPVRTAAVLGMCAYFHGTPPMRFFLEELLARFAWVRVLEGAGVLCVCEHEPAGYLRQENGYPAYGKMDIYVPSEGAD